MNEWWKGMTGTNLAILALGIALVGSTVALFVSGSAEQGLEAVKLLGAGLIGYIGGSRTKETTPPAVPTETKTKTEVSS